MENLTQEEISSVQSFIGSCNDMINGKFILADIKISKILNMIASSEELFKYIQECLIGFDFVREYGRAEVKNRFNNGQFAVPSEQNKLVAMVFSLLVEFDKKNIDFYTFINTNFATLAPGGEYANFAKNLLVPFRDIIANHFGLLGPCDVKSQILISTPNQNLEVSEEDEDILNENSEEDEEVSETNDYSKLDELEAKIWKDLPVMIDSMMNCVMLERKIKNDAKENINYLLKSVKYSAKYKDMRIVSSLLFAVDMLTIKANTVRFILNDLKSEISTYYDELKRLS